MKMHSLGACLPLLIAASAALAQDKSAAESYPSKAIRFIVPYAPGGPTDILARLLGQKLTERWGQPVVADNRAGANGAIGAELLSKSPADGSVLFLGNTSILTINHHTTYGRRWRYGGQPRPRRIRKDHQGRACQVGARGKANRVQG